MTTPFSLPTLHHLQVTFTPERYQEVIRMVEQLDYGQWPPDVRVATDYYACLPTYRIAQCPFCSAMFTARCDTHALLRWDIDANQYAGIFGPCDWTQVVRRSLARTTSQPSPVGNEYPYQDVGCAHFVAVQTFLNLQGTMPSELNRLVSAVGEMPFVISAWLPDDIPAGAVMQSLPLCRVEQGQFVPRYALYCITYYALDADTVRNRRLDEERAFLADDPDYAPVILRPDDRQAYNLRSWVARGKLTWLDPQTRQMIPFGSAPERFPYSAIRGFTRGFTFLRAYQPDRPVRRSDLLWEGPDGIVMSET